MRIRDICNIMDATYGYTRYMKNTQILTKKSVCDLYARKYGSITYGHMIELAKDDFDSEQVKPL